jgi:hypothetical protein
MELYNVYVHLDEKGSGVFKNAVTPAEAQLLQYEHEDLAKKFPLTEVKLTGTAQSIKTVATVDDEGKPVPAVLKNRTDAEELARLKTKYLPDSIEAVFGKGKNVKLPATWNEAFPAVAKPSDEPEVIGACVDAPGELPKSEKNETAHAE